MDRESVERLRFDRRLQQRRGWVEESAYSSHIDELPDVAGKMTTAAELEAEEAAAAAAAPVEEPAPPESTFGEAAPQAAAFSAPRPPGGVAGDFSSSTTLGGGASSGFGQGSDDSTDS